LEVVNRDPSLLPYVVALESCSDEALVTEAVFCTCKQFIWRDGATLNDKLWFSLGASACLDAIHTCSHPAFLCDLDLRNFVVVPGSPPTVKIADVSSLEFDSKPGPRSEQGYDAVEEMRAFARSICKGLIGGQASKGMTDEQLRRAAIALLDECDMALDEACRGLASILNAVLATSGAEFIPASMFVATLKPFEHLFATKVPTTSALGVCDSVVQLLWLCAWKSASATGRHPL
jgi:hypothetical protein